MHDISIYLRKGVRSGKTIISDSDKAIIQKLVAFYFGKIEVENLKELNSQRVSVERFLDVAFYKELKSEIKKARITEELVDRQKLINVIKLLLSENIKSYDELSRISNLLIKEVRRILKNQKLILECGEDNVPILEEKIKILRQQEYLDDLQKSKDETKAKKFKQFDEFLFVYLNSRYRSSDLHYFLNTCATADTVQTNLSKDEFRENYPEDILEQLKMKGEELKHTKPSKNRVIIRNRRLIEIVKPEITQVEQFILTKLELVRDFFEYFGNIERMVVGSKKNLNYNSILSSLMSPELKEYLTEEAYIKLIKYLSIEKNYQSLNYIKRLEFVRDNFIKYSGNLYTVVENKDEEEIALRMLSDKLVKQIAGEEIYNRVLTMLEEYKDKRYVIDELAKVKVKTME